MDSKLFEKAAKSAIANVANYGDTDIFPPPAEIEFFKSSPDEILQILIQMDQDFNRQIITNKPCVIRSMVPNGENGFRLCSQIDPIWNVYFLTLVLCIANEIEIQRPHKNLNTVFSSRFIELNENGDFFDTKSSWLSFTQQTRKNCESYKYILTTDISDFYHCINTHLIKKTLQELNVNLEIQEKLLKFLEIIECDIYGLPIGGPASRLLAEAVLTKFDKTLENSQITYIRFADDIRIFGHKKDDLRNVLLDLGTNLINKGLRLQKSKTQIQKNDEFLAELEFSTKAQSFSNQDFSSEEIRENLLQDIDPYSSFKVQLNEKLSKFANQDNTLRIYEQEFNKSHLNLTLAKNLLSAIYYLSDENLNAVLEFLIEKSDSDAFNPIYSKLINSVDINIHRLNSDLKLKIKGWIENNLKQKNFLSKIEIHQMGMLKIAQKFNKSENENIKSLLTHLFLNSKSSLIKKEIIVLWGIWQVNEGLELSNHFLSNLNAWEYRALLQAIHQHKNSTILASTIISDIVKIHPNDLFSKKYYAWLIS